MMALLIEHGIRSPSVLNAMAGVPRAEFVLEADRERAYDDRALPIAAPGQTISQPLMVAVVVEAPICTAQDTARGKLEEDSGDVAVLILGRAVAQPEHEAGNAEGHQQMLVADIIERDHGAAGEQIPRGDGLEAERFQRDGLFGRGSFGRKQGRQEQGRKQKEGGEKIPR